MLDQIVLHFEVDEGKNPNTEIAAQALLDWVALARATVTAIEPYDKVVFEIIGAEAGSTRFPQIIRFLDRSIENISLAWDDYPHIKKMVVGSAHTLVGATAGAIVATVMAPDVQKVEFSDKERQIQNEMIAKAVESGIVRGTRERFYRTIESDPAIVGVGVANNWKEKPSLIVPRSEFSERSGLWTPQVLDQEVDRSTTDIWDVVLLKVAMVSTPANWTFQRDGLKFGAKMHDANFLAAMKDGRVPINLQEGVIMTVKVERKEKLIGQIWQPISGSWRIIQVISPVPIASSTALPFPKKP